MGLDVEAAMNIIGKSLRDHSNRDSAAFANSNTA
jgi:hypothetical protein